MADNKEGSPALGHYPHLTSLTGDPIQNHTIGKVIVETAEKAGASFDDFNCQGTVTGRAKTGNNVSEAPISDFVTQNTDGMSAETRQRWQNEAYGTIMDDAEFIEFCDIKDVHHGYNWHESGMSPNPIDTPNMVLHSDAVMYAKLFHRLKELGQLKSNDQGDCLAFTFRLQRFLSHGKVYSRYVTHEDGELKFFTVTEEGAL
ncbi:hypothetical protein [Yersinia ruckeri]|uniref:hypothetical protein n=1 Tax=Yersinia ruckeri TaxID=29486 RepID=UPI00223810B9|nr:hypothetical protein [Yersinia ruckeri]MCW6598646.1 hypothetical protein [Yersinia ruckeri]